MSERLKNIIEILVGQTVLELLIKTILSMFWEITQKLLALLNFGTIFKFLRPFTSRKLYFQKVSIILNLKF